MIPGDFQYKKPSKGTILKLGVLGVFGLALLVGVGIVLTYIISAWLGTPAIFASGPIEQPIAFPHTRHVQDLGLDCTFCHRTVSYAATASVPSAGLCMTCHKTVGDGIAEVEQLRQMYEEGRPINWQRVHRVPDHVQFVHSAHIQFFTEAEGIEAQQVCSKCHGDVGSMTVVEQVRPLKMDDCVNCHRDNGAPTDCTTCHY